MTRTTEIDIIAAADWAVALHGGQVRKYTGEPYVTHPLQVAYMLGNYGLPREVVVAGILHDVLEDTDVTYAEIEKRFGKTVAGLVSEVTDVSKPSDGNRAARKALDLQHLAKSSYGGASIKLADIIHNAPSIVTNDPKFARTWVAEKLAQLEVLRHGNAALFNTARDVLEWATTEVVDYVGG